MVNPIKPTGIDASQAVREVAGSTEVEGEAFRVGAATSAPPPADALEVAIREVASDIRAGKLPDHEAAADAVVIRLVNLRFGHLPPTKRDKMILSIHERLHTDPAFQARIEELVATSSASVSGDE